MGVYEGFDDCYNIKCDECKCLIATGKGILNALEKAKENGMLQNNKHKFLKSGAEVIDWEHYCKNCGDEV